MMLHEIKAGKVARNKSRKRVGRGESSGWGKTSGRGHKGEGQRAGSSGPVVFEGGRTPYFRKIPKRGFSNFLFKNRYKEVNIGRLEEKFESGEVVEPETLLAKGLISDIKEKVKVLAKGKLSKSLTVKAHKFSASAEKAITQAGGNVEVIS